MTGMMDTFAPGLFRGRTVLVLGGTSGIGLGAARAFRDLDAQVVATGATEAECAATTDAFGSTGIEFTPLDVRDGTAIGFGA
ncbi:SDR family NAD(P)-dependent oxidoreductase [Microvirga sp. VF16]|uniref:SDR family NAD(P)-dependent oxidoreductase n=1 Tax=Microvirga sp. VF16 TaxID=2807101 RepID=UPI001FF05352|nr:SDR family NAD(P)-dependent oxidoreductase [Microvirga sp. VF16]